MKFKKIQLLKSRKIFQYNEVNFIRVMCAKLYPDKKVYSMKCFIQAIFFKPKINYKNNGFNILISYNFLPEKRKDYAYIYNKLKSFINANEIFVERKFTLMTSLSNIIAFLKILKKNFHEKDIVFFDILRISSLELYFNNVLNEVKKNNFNEKIYISFCDSYLEENLITQFMKNHNIITATLQHGQYRFIKEGLETTDVEGYLNFVSDYIFVWGQATADEFIKANINYNRIIKVGALKEFTNRNSNIIQNKDYKIFTLILNGETHAQSNIEMIKVANEISLKYKIKYYIRPHPMNRLKKYIKYTNENYLGLIHSNTENNVDFSILHMTGVFVEMLSSRLAFFVLKINTQKIYLNMI